MIIYIYRDKIIKLLSEKQAIKNGDLTSWVKNISINLMEFIDNIKIIL